ncbi:hypothetical protein FOZ61_009844 [Perkinsus olseni]|uniref:Uncharacterized protein n=1 Tax=Perkinsus olseni TaxID=32597 RepID=A0A7J6M4G7_PEROL|nr:hypothetical protein FOZ61_009844 [Perkinsus olseni]
MLTSRSSTLSERGDASEHFLCYLGSYRPKADRPTARSGSRDPPSRGWPTLRSTILCLFLAVASTIALYYSWLLYWGVSRQARALSITIDKAEITSPVSCDMLTLTTLENGSRLCARGTAVLKVTSADSGEEVTISGMYGVLFAEFSGACFMLGDFKVGPQIHTTTTTVPFYLLTAAAAAKYHARLNEEVARTNTCTAWLTAEVRFSSWTFQIFLPRVVIRDLKLALPSLQSLIICLIKAHPYNAFETRIVLGVKYCVDDDVN